MKPPHRPRRSRRRSGASYRGSRSTRRVWSDRKRRRAGRPPPQRPRGALPSRAPCRRVARLETVGEDPDVADDVVARLRIALVGRVE